MKYGVIGYGSLLSHNSLKEVIKDRALKPVIVKGYKRVFNLLEENGHKLYDLLNIVESKKSNINGVLFFVNEKELKKLKEREDDYNIEETYCYDFKTKKKVCKCFIFIDHIVAIDRKKLPPDRSYFQLCREAAYHISKEFGKTWDKTTFVSTEEPVYKWIKKNKKYDSVRF